MEILKLVMIKQLSLIIVYFYYKLFNIYLINSIFFSNNTDYIRNIIFSESNILNKFSNEILFKYG